MPKVKGKDQLCSCDRYKTYFKSIQGLGGHTLFDRYNDIENVVNKRIDEKYRHFLAQQEINGDTMQWFSKPYSETPLQLSELQGEEHSKYDRIKNETLSHYQSVIVLLKQQGKNSEAECLEKAIKFVNDDFVYCYDGKTVLGIWGMELRNEIREPLGVAMKKSFVKKKQPTVIEELTVQENETPPEESQMEDEPEINPEPEEPPINPFTVRFNADDYGTLNGHTEYSKFADDYVTAATANSNNLCLRPKIATTKIL